jgi:hypothetical protein
VVDDRPMRRVLLASVLALVVGPATATAAHHRLEVRDPGPVLHAWPPVRDRVLPGRSAVAPFAHAAGTAARYRLPDGTPISASASGAYAATPAKIQQYLDTVFGKLIHGSEMSRLSVRIETPAEVGRDCQSRDALACYSPRREAMFVPGEDTPGQAPTVFVVAHEYGHHIAANRRNDPWYAGTWGPKRWTSGVGVCRGVARGKLFPGDEGKHYKSNPGEAWAESYAMLHFQRFLPYWGFTPTLKPGNGAFALIIKDVLKPWRQGVTRGYRARLRPGHGVLRLRVDTPLDGLTGVRIRTSRGLAVTLRAATGGGRSLGSTRDRRVRLPVCGWRSLRVAIVRRSGRGTVRVAVTRP